MLMMTAVVRERMDLRAGGGIRCEGEDFLSIKVVHGQDQIEIFEIFFDDLSGLSGDLDSTLLKGGAHAAIGGLSGVGVNRTRRVAGDSSGSSIQGEEVTKYIFCRWRTTDVSPADEQDMERPVRISCHGETMTACEDAYKAGELSHAGKPTGHGTF